MFADAGFGFEGPYPLAEVAIEGPAGCAVAADALVSVKIAPA